MKATKNEIKIKELIQLAGIPGYLLIGFYIVQFIFARQKLDATAIDGSAIIFASYAMLCTFWGLKELTQNNYDKKFRNNILFKTPLKWFIYYTFFCFISAIWSSSFALSAYRAIECFGMMIIMVAAMKVLSERTNQKGMVLWCVTYAFIILLFLSISTYFKTNNIYLVFYGCQFPSTIFFFLALYNSPNLLIKIFICGLALLSGSTTGYIGIALGLISLLFGNQKYKFIGIILLIILTITSLIIGFDNILNHTVFYERGGFSFENMSGRNVIWMNAIEQMIKDGKFLTGYGFFAGERTFAVQWIGPQVIGMHNGYLSAYVGTGIIGFILFTIFMIRITLLTLSKKISLNFKATCIASIIIINIHTFGNPGLGFRVYGAWMPSMLMVSLICALYSLKNK